jgi:hypothetical protein
LLLRSTAHRQTVKEQSDDKATRFRSKYQVFEVASRRHATGRANLAGKTKRHFAVPGALASLFTTRAASSSTRERNA